MWTTIDIQNKKSFVGKFQKDRETEPFPLPEIVPDSAKEILIYAWVWIGTGVYPQSNWHYKISVNDDSNHEAAFYVYAHTDPNVTDKMNSFAINSDNFWLPMPPDRIVRVKRVFIRGELSVPEEPPEEPPDIDGAYFDSEVRVIAYR